MSGGTLDKTQASWLERAFANVSSAFSGALYILLKDVGITQRAIYIGLLLQLAQTMVFTINRAYQQPWEDSEAVYPVAVGLSYTTTSRMDVVGGTAAYLALLAVGAVYVGLFLGLTVLTAYNFHYELPHSSFVLRILRSVATLSTTILYLPLSSIMLRGLSCPSHHDSWMGTGMQCNSPGRIVIAILLAILLVGFALMSLTVAAVYVDRDPASQSWAARSTGRVDAGILLAKLVLAFIYNVLDEHLVGSAFLTIVLVAFGLAAMWAFVAYQPHVHAWVNAFQAGIWAVFTISAISLGAAQLAGVENTVLLLYVCSPVAFLAAMSVSLRYSNAITQTPVDQLRSPYDVAVWCNHRMQLYAAFQAVADRGGSAAAHLRGEGDDEEWNNDDEEEHRNDTTGETSDSDGEVAAGKAGKSDGPAETADDRQRRLLTQLARHHASLGMPLQSADQLTIEELEAEKERLLESARVGYEHCIEHFSTSEVSALLASTFYRYHFMFHTQECLCLARALKRQPAFDSRFYIYSRLRRLNESDGSGLGPIERIMFDQEQKQSAQLRIEAYRLLQQLWDIMSEGTPDLVAVETTGVALQGTLTRIEAAFTRLLELNPTSTKTLRAYAQHLIDLKNLPAKATELLTKAERLDETGMRNRMRQIKNVKFGDSIKTASFLNDNAAIVSISGASSSLGDVISANLAACRLFGYSQSAFVGMNIRTIVPPPLKQQHDGMLLRFRRKRKSMVVGHQRLLFGQTRDGSIMPIWLVVRESPPDRESSEPRFTATLDPVNTNEAFLFIGDAASNFRIYAATARACEFLGLEGEMLMQEHVSAANFFPTVAQDFTGGDIQLSKAELQAISRQSGVSDLRDLLRRRKDKGPDEKQANALGKRMSGSKGKSGGQRQDRGQSRVPRGKDGGHQVQTIADPDVRGPTTTTTTKGRRHSTSGAAAAVAASGDSSLKDEGEMPSAHSIGVVDVDCSLARRKAKGESRLPGVGAGAIGVADSSGSFTNLIAAMEEAKAIRSQMYARRRSMQSMAADGSYAAGPSRGAKPNRATKTKGVQGGATATVPNMFKLKAPGLIPMQNTSDGDKLAIGVAQKVLLKAVPVFYVVRLNVIETDSFADDDEDGQTYTQSGGESYGLGSGSDSDASSTHQEGERDGQARRPFSRTGTATSGLTETQPVAFQSRDADGDGHLHGKKKQRSQKKQGSGQNKSGGNRTVKERKEQVVLPPPHQDGIHPTQSVLRGLRGAAEQDRAEDRAEETKRPTSAGGVAGGDDINLLAELEHTDKETVRSPSVLPAAKQEERPTKEGNEDAVEATLASIAAQEQETGEDQAGRTHSSSNANLLSPGSQRINPAMLGGPSRRGSRTRRQSRNMQQQEQTVMVVLPRLSGGTGARRSLASSGRPADGSRLLQGAMAAGSSQIHGMQRQNTFRTHTGHTVAPPMARAPARSGAGKAASVGSAGSSASSQLSRALSQLKDMAEPEVWKIRNLLLMLIVMAVCFATIAVVWVGIKMDKLGQAKQAIWLVGHRTAAFQLARGEVTAAIVDAERKAVTNAYQRALVELREEESSLIGRIAASATAEAMLNETVTAAPGYFNTTAALVAQLQQRQTSISDDEHIIEQQEHVQEGIEASLGSMGESNRALLFAIEQLQQANTQVQDVGFKKEGHAYETGELHSFKTLPDGNEHQSEDELSSSLYGEDDVHSPDEPLSVLEVPLVQEIEEMVSTLQRIARLHLANITVSNGDVRTVRANANGLMHRMQHASNLWQKDYVDYMQQTLLEISVAGGVLLLSLLVVAFFCFVQTARSLGARATNVLEAFMVIPQPVAQAMRGRSSLMLEKVLAEADAAETAEDAHGMDDDYDNGDDEEEAERQLIMNETDAELDNVAEAGAASAGFGGVLRAASRRQMGQDDDKQSRVKIYSIGDTLKKSSKVKHNQDHSLGMTRRRLLYSDREITLRPYRNSSSFVQRTVMWLLLPVVLVLFHLLFVVSLQLIQSQSLSSVGERIMAVFLSRRHVNQYVNDLLDLSIERNTTKWGPILDEADHNEKALSATANLVVFGGAVSEELAGSTLDLSKLSEQDTSTPEGQVRAIFEQDVCLAAKYSPITTDGLIALDPDAARINEAKCRAVDGGVLSEGLISAVSALLSHGRIVTSNAPRTEAEARQRLKRHHMPNANSTELIYLLASSPLLAEEVVNALYIEHPFVKLGASVSATLLSNLVDDKLSFGKSLLNVVSWSFVGVFSLILLLFYYPNVSELGVPLRSARNLLSLLPGELVASLPDLRATVQDIATDAQLAQHGSASARSGRQSSRSSSKKKEHPEDQGLLENSRAGDWAAKTKQGQDSWLPSGDTDSKARTSTSHSSHFNFDVAAPSRAMQGGLKDRSEQ